jgi:FKBP-type peptidyl-prolyl cis-trans isomerase FkpA
MHYNRDFTLNKRTTPCPSPPRIPACNTKTPSSATAPEAKAGQYVTVHYTGWLRNDDGSQGAKFDSSKDRNDPFQFPLGAGHVIKGWDEGVQGMKVGGARRLIIPASLGYGARGAGGVIPPNAT